MGATKIKLEFRDGNIELIIVPLNRNKSRISRDCQSIIAPHDFIISLTGHGLR